MNFLNTSQKKNHLKINQNYSYTNKRSFQMLSNQKIIIKLIKTIKKHHCTWHNTDARRTNKERPFVSHEPRKRLRQERRLQFITHQNVTKRMLLLWLLPLRRKRTKKPRRLRAQNNNGPSEKRRESPADGSRVRLFRLKKKSHLSED